MFNKIAKQASGAVMYKIGKAVLITAIAIDENSIEEDFLPLTVQYIEKSYSAGKIPGGFIKREGKPSDFETLTSRVVDRSIRPLFPKGFHYPVVVTILVVSSDTQVDMQLAALNSTNAALFISDIPVSQNISAVRVVKVENEIIVNPSLDALELSILDLFIVGTHKDLLMIEMRSLASKKINDIDNNNISESQSCNALEEDELIDLIYVAREAINKVTLSYDKAFAPLVRDSLELDLKEEKIDTELYDFISDNFSKEVTQAVNEMAKSERSSALKRVRKEIIASYEIEVDEDIAKKVVEAYKKSVVRNMILNNNIRADGRALDEVRPISIETSLLPSVHGSCLFTRGETQALVVVTLGDNKDAQFYDLITSKDSKSERFMVHYNFPGFSVGEAKFNGAPGRRELGHGNLAKRALEPSIDLNYDGTIRLVSEILESNGSSSMATVCGGSLALRSADIAVVDLVAGIAMGLVSDGTNHAILTDIMGLEDHDGDMDFKVTGTRDGITALQMDIKLGGIDLGLLKEALSEANKGKNYILDLMEEAEKNTVPSEALPITELFYIHPSKVVDIIGKAGATIRDIIEKFDINIDIDRDKGGVKLVGSDKEKVINAKAHIKNIADAPIKKQSVYEKNRLYQGKIKKIVDFGMFIEMPDGFDALLHISKISKTRMNNLSDKFTEGDNIAVIVMEQNGKKVGLATPEYLN
ncbi:MAG: polyribonucleotide nucleotidyltransferase [Sulfurovum sp.]|nr:polyribonucleotide nucleotidyltransferase [Sulfurovaceae bacterium]